MCRGIERDSCVILLDSISLFLFNEARPPVVRLACLAGDTRRLGGMVAALDAKSSSLKECGFESHSR